MNTLGQIIPSNRAHKISLNKAMEALIKYEDEFVDDKKYYG